MECLIQYLDDMEDAVYAFLLLGERVRRAARSLFVFSALLLVQVGGIALALHWPPVALGLVALLAVGTLYRSTVSLTPDPARS